MSRHRQSRHRRPADEACSRLRLADDGAFFVVHTWVAAWFGRGWLGARVEWAAGVYPDVDDRAVVNEIGPTAASRLERIEWGGRSVLVSPLDLQLAANERRRLTDRVAAIRAHMAGL